MSTLELHLLPYFSLFPKSRLTCSTVTLVIILLLWQIQGNEQKSLWSPFNIYLVQTTWFFLHFQECWLSQTSKSLQGSTLGKDMCFSVDGLWEFSIRSQQLSADKSQGQVKSIRVFISFTTFFKIILFIVCVFKVLIATRAALHTLPSTKMSSVHGITCLQDLDLEESWKYCKFWVKPQELMPQPESTEHKHQTWGAPPELRVDEEKCIYSTLKVQEFNPEGRMMQGQVLVLLVLKHGLSSTFYPLNNWWVAESTDWPCLQSPPGKSPQGGDTSGCDPAAASAVLAFFLMAKRKHVSLREHLLGKQSSVEGERIHLSFHIYFGGTIVSFSMSK